jgi:hypothetical protein
MQLKDLQMIENLGLRRIQKSGDANDWTPDELIRHVQDILGETEVKAAVVLLQYEDEHVHILVSKMDRFKVLEVLQIGAQEYFPPELVMDNK